MTLNERQFGDLSRLSIEHHAPDPRHDPAHPKFDGDWDSADHEANHSFVAHLPGVGTVGNLELRGRDWDDEDLGVTRPRGEILGVEVAPHFQRMGIASRLLDHARSSGFDVHHSPNRTDEGDAWAAKVDPRHGVQRRDF